MIPLIRHSGGGKNIGTYYNQDYDTIINVVLGIR